MSDAEGEDVAATATKKDTTPFDHESVERLADGRIRVRLVYGIEGHAAVTFMRPKAKHMMEVAKTEGDIRGDAVMVAKLTGLDVDQVGELDLEDYTRCVWIAQDLVGKSMTAGLSG